MTPPNPDYPLRLEVDYPDRLSRLLIFVKWLLAIPHFIALWLVGFGVAVVWTVSWFVIIITGRYPRGMFEFMTGALRWSARVGAYLYLLTDRYPPFTLADDPSYPVRLEIDHPERVARWRPLLHGILALPAALAAFFVFLVGYLSVVVGWFAILFTGRMPQGLFDAVVVTLRWSMRLNAYEYWMTTRYPPFVWA
jgi:Domain of unknown function (DUF4389)